MTETRMGEECECGECEERFDQLWKAWACVACGTLARKDPPDPSEPLPPAGHDSACAGREDEYGNVFPCDCPVPDILRNERARIVKHMRARAAVESRKADELDAVWKSKEHTPYIRTANHHAALCHRYAAECLIAEVEAIEGSGEG